MQYNPLKKIQDFGQSIWLDYLRRDMIESGELQKLIDEDGLRGITSNPQIFWKAIDGSDDYTTAILALSEQHKSKEEIYRTITVEDVQHAADMMRPIYDSSDASDGFVSLEVNPHLARDAEGTINEARDLWRGLNRPNVFIKIPATKEGLTSIRTLISEGINVNVTLLFGLDRYHQVAEAYISGLEDRLKNNQPIDGVGSVASFFLSRIDVKVDSELEEIIKKKDKSSGLAEKIHGKTAVAAAKVAYQMYHEIFESDRFRKLTDNGAKAQRLLWASTSTKNPSYSDIKYVEALIGPNTVNTVPQETINAYRDHGQPAARLEENIDDARSVLEQLKKIGIDIHRVTAELIEEGIAKFNKPYDETMKLLDQRMATSGEKKIDYQELSFSEYDKAVTDRIAQLADKNFSKRLWRKDTRLWSDDTQIGKQIRNSLGWLHVAEKMLSNVPDLIRFATEVRQAGIRHVVHLGMGGSSLAPLVFQKTFPIGENGLPLTVLDTTDPTTVQSVEKEFPLEDTLFIVASKSGSTAETITFMEYFRDRLIKIKGDKAGDNFAVITDPGSALEEKAKQFGFRKVFPNYSDIGGRYSALSYFGLVPAALMGIDVELLLERAIRMAHANQSKQSPTNNPAIILGAVIGELARAGRDKLTFLTSPSIASLGTWLEQLLAESTGKEGTGILPVAGESIGEPDVYNSDRVFVYFELQDEKYDKNLKKLHSLMESGHPVIIIRLDDKYDIGQEMMRWEIATATAGTVLEINPFDQPNVQESKDNTNRLLKVVVKEGALPSVKSVVGDKNADSYADVSDESNLKKAIAHFLDKARDNDYIDIQAYLTENSEVDRALQEIRETIRSRLKTATTAGYGPRYLHSTGQFHKGGPNSGLFIQLSCDSPEDIGIPGREYSFGVLIKTQALGDLEALLKHGRRVIRIDLGKDVNGGLNRLLEAVTQGVPQVSY